jgi:hypothetical protein
MIPLDQVATLPHKNCCRTGNQALVSQINLSMIMNRLRESALISHTTLAEMKGLNRTAHTGDGVALEALDEVGHYLGVWSTRPSWPSQATWSDRLFEACFRKSLAATGGPTVAIYERR